MKRGLFFLFFSISLLSLKGQNINELLDLYSKRELDKALELSTVLISNEKENGIYNQIHGRILSDLGKYKSAIPYLLKAIEIDSNKTDISVWAHGYLGQCYFVLGQYENSENSLNDCVKLNATKNSLKYANKRLFQFGFDEYFSSWKIIETEDIRFHIQFPDKVENMDQFILLRENAFQKIKNTLGCTLPKKVDFFVWDTKEEPLEKFKIKLGLSDPINACVYSHKKQTIGHEMTHVISHYLGQNPQKTGLINEGLAVYFNMENNDKLETLKGTINKGGYNNLEVSDFWENWQNYPDEISYPLAGAFIKVLIDKYGIEKLKPLLIDQTYLNAKILLGADLDTLINDFERDIKSD